MKFLVKFMASARGCRGVFPVSIGPTTWEVAKFLNRAPAKNRKALLAALSISKLERLVIDCQKKANRSDWGRSYNVWQHAGVMAHKEWNGR